MSAAKCERSYRRGKAGPHQVRTRAGRLIASGAAVEAVEWLAVEGRGRVLWRRSADFGRVIWLSREVRS